MKLILSLFALAALTAAIPAREKELPIKLLAVKTIIGPAPVSVPLTLSPEQAKWTTVAAGPILGQLTAPGLATEHIKPSFDKGIRRDLHVIVPGTLKAGESLTLSFKPAPDQAGVNFTWKDKQNEYADLCTGARPVLRYMYRTYDESSPDKRNKTYKVFHHLYDPKGARLVTNGGFADEGAADAKKLLYPHHRGLMLGFMKTGYGDGKKADTWHCTGNDHLSHERFLITEQGPVLGRHRLAIHWFGGKDVIVKEERELTVYTLPGGTLVEFDSLLRPASGKVTLDGDPQHAGFQFRASNDVAAKTAKETYFVRPDGKGKPGDTRNWPGSKTQHDLPWDAMSFVLDGQRYTVCYLNHPQNPRDSRFSERDYGRFGCYFVRELTEQQPLLLRYRIWLQEGEMTGPQVQALSDAFKAPPQAK